MAYIENPKTKGSGVICCIPQTGTCPVKCSDCFFTEGRSYLQPLEDNLPNIPSAELSENRIVRMNDGNDSNHQRGLVESAAMKYKDFFFNTSQTKDIDKFPGPVVLTVNPGKMTDKIWWRIEPVPANLMFVRVRTNSWNIDSVVTHAINYYTENRVPVVLTFMAYYNDEIPDKHKFCYEWKKRTLNSYWCMKREDAKEIEDMFDNNPLVYSCGYKGTYSCSRCGNCLREYYNAKERMKHGPK